MSGLPIIAVMVLTWVLANLVHVAAHLGMARLFGIEVNRVSLGVGPVLRSRMRGQTRFCLCLIPVAVLVRLRARWTRDVDGIWPPLAPTDFRGKGLGPRLAVAAGAPVAVLLLGLCAGFWQAGYRVETVSDEAVVGQVLPDRPAERAGLVAGDRIMAVNGAAVADWTSCAQAIGGAPEGIVTLDVVRGDQRFEVELVPERAPEGDRRIIGIGRQVRVAPAPGFGERIGLTFTIAGGHLARLFRGLPIVSSGAAETETLGGPIVLYAIAQRSPEREGYWLAMMATLRLLSLFVLCLILPYLDGRRLLFLGIEAVARRPIHPRYEQWTNRVMLGLVGIPYLLVIWRDVAHYTLG